MLIPVLNIKADDCKYLQCWDSCFIHSSIVYYEIWLDLLQAAVLSVHHFLIYILKRPEVCCCRVHATKAVL